ncbi:MAG: hypothetical protein K2L77_03880 [Muribaculaceae bacterium]|nr:hypothetical protein [Muribaculaceae bacterium]
MSRLQTLSRAAAVIVAALMMAPSTAAPPPAWETVDTTVTGLTDEIEVTVHDRYIYVSVSKPTAVKLFTILGQPVAQATLPQGISRLQVRARGIYILKAASITKRITI